MQKIITIITSLVLYAAASEAQNKTPMPARPSEKSEIRADNRLGKQLQQKQLQAVPERIADSAITIKVKPAPAAKKTRKAKIKSKNN